MLYNENRKNTENRKNDDYRSSEMMMEDTSCTKGTVINDVLTELVNLGSMTNDICSRLERLSERAGTREECIVDTNKCDQSEPSTHVQRLGQKLDFLRNRLFYCEQRISELELFI
jgi:hypothetical protein